MAVITEKSVLKTEAIFSEDKKSRYLLRKEWDKNKERGTVLMINPSVAGEVAVDHTTMYILNNLTRLGYGSVDIVNIYSKIANSTKADNSTDEINDNQIEQSAKTSSNVVIAWGKLGESNKRVHKRQIEVLKILEPYRDKLQVIACATGEEGFHPLSPKAHEWLLKPFKIEEVLIKEEEINQKEAKALATIEQKKQVQEPQK